MKSKLPVFLAIALLMGGAAVFLFRPAGAPPSDGAVVLSTPAGASPAEIDWNARAAAANAETFAAAMDDALLIADEAERRRVIAALAVRWLNVDRMSFVAYLEEVEVLDATESAGKFGRLLPALAEAFPNVDKKAAASAVYNDAVQKFVELWAEVDLPSARAWVERWLLDDARDQAAAILIAAMENPEEAQALLDTIRQPYRRVEGTAALAGLLAERDPRSAYAWANARPNSLEKTIALENALPVIAEQDPAVAGAFLREFAATVDAEAAAARARLPKEAPASTRERGPAGEGRLSPEQAIETNRRSQLARMRETAGAIAEEMAARDPGAAAAWAAALPEGSLRAEAQNAVVAAQAEAAPAEAFAAYRALPTAKAETAGVIFERWATQDPAAAAPQIAALPDASTRREAVRGLVTGWAETDDVAAEEWVATQPAGAERDVALDAFARAISETDPQAAWTHAVGIGDAAAREEALAAIFPDVVAESPETASRLLAQVDLPTDVARSLQRQVDGATKVTR